MITRTVLSEKDMRILQSTLEKDYVYHIPGATSVWVPSQNTKYMLADVSRRWTDLNDDCVVMTPGEAARTELRRAFPDIRRVGWSGPMISLFKMTAPAVFTGPAQGYFIYIDLKAAYYQFYRKLWLDTPYPCGYGQMYPLASVAEALKDWKTARNSVLGVCAARRSEGVRGPKRRKLFVTNSFLAPGLWATVMSLLHWVAAKALECGAIYINTDGYIFNLSDYDKVDEFICWLGEHEIAMEVRDVGDSTIRTWNNYQIGFTKTKPFQFNLKTYTKEFNNVRTTDYDWGSYWRNCGRYANP